MPELRELLFFREMWHCDIPSSFCVAEWLQKFIQAFISELIFISLIMQPFVFIRERIPQAKRNFKTQIRAGSTCSRGVEFLLHWSNTSLSKVAFPCFSFINAPTVISELSLRSSLFCLVSFLLGLSSKWQKNSLSGKTTTCEKIQVFLSSVMRRYHRH